MSTRVVVVGGGSRAARALRQLLSRDSNVDLDLLSRRGTDVFPSERLTRVSDYFSPPDAILADAAAVVNFAGVVAGDARAMRAVNVEGAVRLAQIARRAGARQFIHIGSLSVYGSTTDIGSVTPEQPQSDYGRTKRDGDVALLSLADENFAVTIMRVPILYSASTTGKLNQLASMASKLGVVPVPSSLEPRSTLHHDNLAIAIRLAIEELRAGIIFAADPEPFTLDLLCAAAAAKRRTIRLLRLPDSAFAAIRRLAPGLYASLYGRSLIASSALSSWSNERPRATLEAIGDLFAPASER